MIHEPGTRTQWIIMSGGDDFEGHSEEATADAAHGVHTEEHEVTRSTYWAVQAVKVKGETRVVSRQDLATEADPEEPTDPLPGRAPPPQSHAGIWLLLLLVLIVLGALSCMGAGAVYWLASPRVATEVEPEPTPAPPAPTQTEVEQPAPAPPQAAAAPTPPPQSRPAEPTGPTELSVVAPEPEEPTHPEPAEPTHPEPAEPTHSEPEESPEADEPLELPEVALLELPADRGSAEPFLLIGELTLAGPGSEPQLRNVVELARPELEACYATALEQDPSLVAELKLNLRMLADGSVLGARARQRGKPMGELTPCVERIMLSKRFPGLPGAASIQVPLSFGLSEDPGQE